MFAEVELRARQACSQRAFFRALARGAADSELVEMPGGVQATVVPVRPWYSIFNTVLYGDADALLVALPDVAGQYEAAGTKAWTVWVPPGEERVGARLAREGHVLDSTPMLMAAPICELDLGAQVSLDLHRAPTSAIVAAVNDRAHGVLPQWSMTAVVERLDESSVRPYVALQDREPVCALLAQEAAGDCYFWFVATAPEARGRGLASELVRHALREAQNRDCATTTLESTAMAESTYARMGYHRLGRYCMWERRVA